VVRVTIPSGQVTRCPMITGVSGRYELPSLRSRSWSSVTRVADRYTAVVAPGVAWASTDSPAGIDAIVRRARRVCTTVCAIPGTVSSTPAAAAVAATDETPGTTSKARPLRRHHAICSAMAP